MIKTRTTRLTLTNPEGTFEVEIIDEGAGEYVLVSCGLDHPPFDQHISINPSEWPFLRDAIDRMFVEIAENDSGGKIKELLETPVPWEEVGEGKQAPPAETSEASGEELAKPASDDGWIPWDGGVCPVHLDRAVQVRYRCGLKDNENDSAYIFRWLHNGDDYDIVAYKVVG